MTVFKTEKNHPDVSSLAWYKDQKIMWAGRIDDSISRSHPYDKEVGWRDKEYVENLKKLIKEKVKFSEFLMDIGPWDGFYFPFYFDTLNVKKIIGVDICDNMLSELEKKHRLTKEQFQGVKVEAVPNLSEVKSYSVDTVISIDSLTRATREQIVAYSREIERVLTKKGTFILHLVMEESMQKLGPIEHLGQSYITNRKEVERIFSWANTLEYHDISIADEDCAREFHPGTFIVGKKE